MRVRIDGATYAGRVIDLRARDLDGRAVATAIRGDRVGPLVDCSEPGRLHDYGGWIHPEMGFRTRTALAAAARTRGHETDHDEEIERLRAELSALDPSPPSLTTPAETVPEGAVAAARERTATLRGRLQARQAVEADTEDVRAAFRSAARELSERETQRTAASQSRVQRREEAREYRAQTAERSRLADALANRERDARRTLVETVRAEFDRAVAAAPGPTPDDPFDASPVTAALAVWRLADSPAPVVVEVDRFTSPSAAADWLECPVVRC